MQIKVLKLPLTLQQSELEQHLQQWIDSLDLNIVDLKITPTTDHIVYTAIAFPLLHHSIPEEEFHDEISNVILQG